VVSGTNHDHKMDWQFVHSNTSVVWLSISKLYTPVEQQQLQPQACPLYEQLQPRHTRIYPKSQADNAPDDLKGSVTNSTMSDEPTITQLARVYVYNSVGKTNVL